MVSRRKILSRSRDDLNVEQPAVQEEEEDVWYQRDKLYKVGRWLYRVRGQYAAAVLSLSPGPLTAAPRQPRQRHTARAISSKQCDVWLSDI
jgi:hypothetical protein